MDRMYQQVPGPAGRLQPPPTLHTMQPGGSGMSTPGQPLPPPGVQQFHSPASHHSQRPAQAPTTAPSSAPTQGLSPGVK